MGRIKDNVAHCRFNLIVNKVLSISNEQHKNFFASSYDLIVASYGWIDSFIKMQADLKTDLEKDQFNEYKNSLIYYGINSTTGNPHKIVDSLQDFSLDYGLLNSHDNRTIAATYIEKSFTKTDEYGIEIKYTTDEIIELLDKMFRFLEAEFLQRMFKTNKNRIFHKESLKAQIGDYLIPSLCVIDNPYEQLAGLLIYAQSGCLPLDSYKAKFEKVYDENKELSEIIKRNSNVETILPDALCGDFWGCFYNSNYTCEQEIDTFELTIDKNNIKLTIHQYATDHNNHNHVSRNECILYGRVIHNQSKRTDRGLVVIDFQEKDGDFFCIMTFNLLPMKTCKKIHYRKGAMLIQTRGGDIPLPVIQSFIFTESKIDLNIEENEEYIRGLLKLNYEYIYIEKEKLEKHIDNKLLQDYINSGHALIEKQFIAIDEYSLHKLAINNIKDTERYMEFLKLKNESISATLHIVSTENKSFHYIASLYNSFYGSDEMTDVKYCMLPGELEELIDADWIDGM